ncbi:MAG: hypothetical protein JWP01_3614 [Myxococcales bacterium]|nr:hypothetical protein [Myxococcales bacterium]
MVAASLERLTRTADATVPGPLRETPSQPAAREDQRVVCGRGMPPSAAVDPAGIAAYGRAVKPSTASPGHLPRVATLGGLLGIKTSPLLARLAPAVMAMNDKLVVTVPHSFDALTVTTRVSRDIARGICGPWLDALPGDTLDVEIGATTVTASSDEAALPATAPALVASLGADAFSALATDGSSTTYVFEQANDDAGAVAATLAHLDRVAVVLGITEPQRRIAANLHDSLARGTPSRLTLRARDGVVEPRVCMVWDRVEWRPIQSMLGGFYPSGRGVELVARLTGSIDAVHATVELVLGPTDPPGLRFSFALV